VIEHAIALAPLTQATVSAEQAVLSKLIGIAITHAIVPASMPVHTSVPVSFEQAILRSITITTHASVTVAE
jgi:hypothetical protein